MNPFVIGAAVIGIGALALSFIQSEMEERRDQLREEESSWESKIDELDSYSYREKRRILWEQFEVLKEEILEKVEEFEKEKIKIKDLIEGYLAEVDRRIEDGKKRGLPSFYLNEYYRSRLLLLYGLKKVKAYFHYLEFFRRKIERMEEKGRPQYIFDLPPVEAFLPTDYLFPGKLVEVEEDEWEEYNRFSQRLFYLPSQEKYLSKRNYALITHFDHDKKGFVGDIVKGELALFARDGTFFEVKAMETQRRGPVVVRYKGVDMILGVGGKRWSRRIFKGEKLEVRIESTDLYLNRIFVTEKGWEEEIKVVAVTDNPLPRGKPEIIEGDTERVVLKLGDKKLTLSYRENHLVVEEVTPYQLEEGAPPPRELPVEISFVTPAQFELISDFIIPEEVEFFKGIALSTLNFYNQENSFIQKYIQLLDYQIEVNRYQLLFRPYRLIEEDGNAYLLRVKLEEEFEEGIVEIDGKEFVIRDASPSQNLLKIDKVVPIPPSGLLKLKLFNYPYPLIQQRRAVTRFLYNQMANLRIKRALVDPAGKKYFPQYSQLHLNFRNSRLTPNQRELVEKSLNERDLFLIQGPPGTGKTTVIKEIIYQTLQLNPNARILVVSQQNVAVDNVLEGILKEEITDKIVRIGGDEGKVYPSLRQFMIEKKFKDYLQELKEKGERLPPNLRPLWEEWYNTVSSTPLAQLDDTVKEYLIKRDRVIGATCVGLANKKMGLELSTFDLAIIDEAGRATLGELLIPIVRVKKVILIGDHHQLPPTVDARLRDKMEQEEGFTPEDLEILEKSYFEELYTKVDPSAKGMLIEQFRMPNQIGDLISTLFYDGKLKNGRDRPVPSSLIWIDVKGREKRQGTSRFNLEEAKKIVSLLPEFTKKEVAVITPYSAQKRVIRQLVKQQKITGKIKIDTIDSFQGEEADIVFYSTVRRRGNIQFLLDRRRLNVAISRTRERLFFVGDWDFFKDKPIFSEIIKRAKRVVFNPPLPPVC